MNNEKATFAVFFGNRGFFPASLQAGARDDMSRVFHTLWQSTMPTPTLRASTTYGDEDLPCGHLRPGGHRQAALLADEQTEHSGL